MIEPTGIIDVGTISTVKYLVGFINFVLIFSVTFALLYWYKNK